MTDIIILLNYYCVIIILNTLIKHFREKKGRKIISMENALTILIPTYNRKEKLIKTLLTLQDQYNQNFKIIIMDNASNYSIEDEITEALDNRFRSDITVLHHKYNIGMGNNISSLFMICETKWGWLLGDDDIINQNAVNTVLNNIEKDPDCGGFWFALDQSYKDRVVVDNPAGLIDLKIQRNLFNDSCYLSNKIYNFDYIGMYSETIFHNSYTMISFSLAIFEMLKSNIRFNIIFDESIVIHPGFKGNGNKPTWNIYQIASGMRTIVDYQVSEDFALQKRYISCSFFPWKQLVHNWLSVKQYKKDKNYQLKNIYYDCYKRTLPFFEKIECRIILGMLTTRWGYQMLAKVLNVRNARS